MRGLEDSIINLKCSRPGDNSENLEQDVNVMNMWRRGDTSELNQNRLRGGRWEPKGRPRLNSTEHIPISIEY